MLKRKSFTGFATKRFLRAPRVAVVHPPTIPTTTCPERTQPDPALSAFIESVNRHRPERRGFGPFWALSARLVLVASFTFWLFSSHAEVREVGVIGLTVNDLNKEIAFYTNTLPFQLVSFAEESGPDLSTSLGLRNVHVRVAELRLGDERINLTEHLTAKGRAIPADSRSYDLWFQHIAIVVSDMDKAYARLGAHKVKHVSTAPQTLPDWNKNASGIKAFYFRDPEDHVLEIIYFPPGKGNPKWQTAGTNVFLGVDHTAIVVSDTDKSLGFYRDALGLHVTGASENYGAEQEHLNQVFGARLRITALRAERGPGIEFLEYLTPPGGRSLPGDSKPNDLVFWNTQLLASDATALAKQLRDGGTRFVSKASANLQILRDPDGHVFSLQQIGEPIARK